MTEAQDSMKARLLAAALPHVAFDGWSDAAFRAAASETEIGLASARTVCPRGALDLAVAFHRAGDAAMVAALGLQELSDLRFSERVALAIRLRLEGADREIVRRGAALFALPQHAATGAGLIWGTADAIWRALGDRSDDFAWYSKRATLSAVYGATVLYWLADESEGQIATWAFVDRRIADVMQIEKAKATIKKAPVLGPLLSGPLGLLGRIRAPAGAPDDLPGRVTGGAAG